MLDFNDTHNVSEYLKTEDKGKETETRRFVDKHITFDLIYSNICLNKNTDIKFGRTRYLLKFVMTIQKVSFFFLQLYFKIIWRLPIISQQLGPETEIITSEARNIM